MWFALIWTAILVIDLLLWALFSRLHQIHLQGYRLPYMRRSLIMLRKPRRQRCEDKTMPPEKDDNVSEIPSQVQKTLSISNTGIGDWGPPSAIRNIVTLAVLVQNALAICIMPSQNAIRSACTRSGQLAIISAIPLVLLAFPDIALGRVVRQDGPEMTWAHHLFGWLVWLNTVVHVGLSNATSAESRK